MPCAGLARDGRCTGTELAVDTGLFRHALHDEYIRVLAVAALAIGAVIRRRERNFGPFLASVTRPCAGERFLLAHRQRLLSGSTKTSTHRHSCLQSLDLCLAVLTLRLHHDHTCPVQRRVCDDRRGGYSSRRGTIEVARLVRDLEPAVDPMAIRSQVRQTVS